MATRRSPASGGGSVEGAPKDRRDPSRRLDHPGQPDQLDQPGQLDQLDQLEGRVPLPASPRGVALPSRTLASRSAGRVSVPASPRGAEAPARFERVRRRTRGRFDDPGSSGNDARDALLGEDRLGDGGVTGAELAKMGSRVAARHLMTLLAHGGGEGTREARLAQVGDLVITLDRPELVRHVLLDLPEAGRIVDIYPLEVLAYVLERRPDLLEDMGFGDVVLDKTRLERRVYRPDETIVLGVALALRMRAFALEGGGAPGYCFQPGPPGEYHLTFGEAGVHRLLMRGEVHGRSTVDRVVLQVADG